MNNNEIQLIKNNVKKQLEGKMVSPIFLSGEPGTSKSTTVQLLALELGMNILDVSCPCLTHESLSGLPQEYIAPELTKYTIDGSEAVATRWSIPEIIADANKLSETSPTILLLDDFHMVQPHLQSYFFKLLLQRSIGNYKLADNVAIVGTMNDSESAGFKGINSAVRNRMAVLNIKFQFDYWYQYGKNLHYLVASFLKAKPELISSEESVYEQYSTARSFTGLANELEDLPSDFVLANAKLMASMYVKESTAQAFAKHVAYVTALNFQEMVDKRTLITLSEREPEEAIICSYIARFIVTIEDALYLLKLISKNMDEHTFIGFLVGELSEYYKNRAKSTKGIEFIISLILGIDEPLTNQADVLFIEDFKTNHLTQLMALSSDYVN